MVDTLTPHSHTKGMTAPRAASALLLSLLPLISFAACSNASRTLTPVPSGVGSSATADPATKPAATDPAKPATTDPGAPEQMPANSQTGSIGASPTSECTVDADCVDTSQSGPTGTVELVAAQCLHLTVTSELPLCDCSLRFTSTSAADAGAGSSLEYHAYPGNRPGGCSELSRTGACLYCESEFPGCDIRDVHSCDAVCADVAQRQDREARRSYDVRTRLARCVAEPTNVCHVITEIDGQCYFGRFGAWLPAPVDCSLSDDALAAHFKDPMAEPCGPRPAGSCSRSEDCPRGLACTNGVCQSCEQRCSLASSDGSEVASCEGGGACAANETCAQGTCVPTANAACGWQDFSHPLNCPADQQCYVTGISNTGRGNESSQSFCTGATNDPAQRPQE